MKCGDLRGRMASYESGAEPTRRELRHLSKCRECAQEMARYGLLAESLQALRSQVVTVPAALEAALVAIPSARRPRLRPAAVVTGHLRRNRRSYAGGLALALTAGAATWATRSRRLQAA
jgi:hypothetical protein